MGSSEQRHTALSENTTKVFRLNTGDLIPAVGLGTRRSQPNEVSEAVITALRAGYRHIDTEFSYHNEKEVGEGIRASGVPRSQIWLTTKLSNCWHTRVAEALDLSLHNLGTDYVDLYLIHWPCSIDPDDPTKHIVNRNFVDTWREMQNLVGTGKVRNIGVSNFGITNLERLLSAPHTKIIPAVNQIELHPGNLSRRLVAYNTSKGIHTTGYSPLGSSNSPLCRHETILSIAEIKGRTPQQILIVWGLQKGWSLVPKSVNRERILENWDLDGCELTMEEIAQIDGFKEQFKVYHDDWLPTKAFYSDDD